MINKIEHLVLIEHKMRHNFSADDAYSHDDAAAEVIGAAGVEGVVGATGVIDVIPAVLPKNFPIISPMDPLIEALCEEGVTLAVWRALLYDAKYSSPLVYIAGVDCHSRYTLYIHSELRDADGSMRCGLFALCGVPFDVALRIILTNELPF